MDVLNTVGPAVDTAKRRLKPEASSWFAFGVIFFLQSCVEGGASCGGANQIGKFSNLGSWGSPSPSRGSKGAENMLHGLSGLSSGGPLFGGHELEKLKGLLAFGVPLLLLFGFLAFLFWGLFIAIGSLGQAFSIHAVATGETDLTMSDEIKTLTTRFIKFHLLQSLLSLLIFGPGLAVVLVKLPWAGGDLPTDFFGILAVIVVATFGMLLPIGFFGAFFRNFVAPISLLRRCTFMEAYRIVVGAPSFSWLAVVGAFLLRLVYGMIAGVVATILGIVTCCIGFLPVLHQTLMAPYYIFERAHTLQMLAALGPDYNVFRDEGLALPYGPGGFPTDADNVFRTPGS
jgi:hypothetical protein